MSSPSYQIRNSNTDGIGIRWRLWRSRDLLGKPLVGCALRTIAEPTLGQRNGNIYDHGFVSFSSSS